MLGCFPGIRRLNRTSWGRCWKMVAEQTLTFFAFCCLKALYNLLFAYGNQCSGPMHMSHFCSLDIHFLQTQSQETFLNDNSSNRLYRIGFAGPTVNQTLHLAQTCSGCLSSKTDHTEGGSNGDGEVSPLLSKAILQC